MIAITYFAFFAVVNLVVAGSVQQPEVTYCKDADDSLVEVNDVTITNAELGKQAKIDFSFTLKETIGGNPILKISFATPRGRPVDCIHVLIPQELRLCGGDLKMEQEVTMDWNNECPIEEGEHTASLSVYLPNMALAKICLGDGEFVVTLEVQDEESTLFCASFPVSVDLGGASLLR